VGSKRDSGAPRRKGRASPSRRAPGAIPDPIAQFNDWFDLASRAGTMQPEATALATAGRGGRVSVRFVLLKSADASGFVFYTNALSRKGRDLAANPRAGLVFWWDRIGKQVRVEGRVRRVSAAEADEYWRSRPRLSRLAGAVSRQSAPVESRAILVARMEALRRRLRGRDVPRPPHWTGFRIIPDEIEFWTLRAHRLHERELFVRSARGWSRTILQP
jgi:pyridoxamine 5'-phosphate oxidase